MSEKLPDPLPAHLASLSDEDLAGVIKRAERDGIPLDQIKLREKDLAPEFDLDTDDQMKKDAMGIVARSKAEGKPVKQLKLRKSDDPMTVATMMAELIKTMGFAVKSTANRPKTGKLSGADVDRMIAEEKAKKNKE